MRDQKVSKGASRGKRKCYLDVLLLVRVHTRGGQALSGLVALVGIVVVRVRGDGSLALVHLGLGRVDRQVLRVLEPHGNERARNGGRSR